MRMLGQQGGQEKHLWQAANGVRSGGGSSGGTALKCAREPAADHILPPAHQLDLGQGLAKGQLLGSENGLGGFGIHGSRCRLAPLQLMQ